MLESLVWEPCRLNRKPYSLNGTTNFGRPPIEASTRPQLRPCSDAWRSLVLDIKILGFTVWGFGFRIYGLKSRVWDLGFRVGLRFWV